MTRVLVAGTPQVLAAVQRALPEMNVVPAPALDAAAFADSDCLMVDSAVENAGQAWRSFVPRVPMVRLVQPEQNDPGALDEDDTPSADVEHPQELRLAVRTAILQERIASLLVDLTGLWAHDTRGALGVARLGLELLRTGTDPTNAIQKVENGVMRLGFLVERLPPQVALALDRPVASHGAPGLFPSLDSYVKHLRLTHSRRSIVLAGDDLALSGASQVLVPFAAGFADLAFKLSSPRTAVRFSVDDRLTLEVECECPERPDPWNVGETLVALELSRSHDPHLPYRLVEAARLALRSGSTLSLQFTERAFLGRVELNRAGT